MCKYTTKHPTGVHWRVRKTVKKVSGYPNDNFRHTILHFNIYFCKNTTYEYAKQQIPVYSDRSCRRRP